MLLNVLVDNHLIQFLFPANLLWFITGKSDGTQVFKKEFAFFELLTVTLVKAGVTFGTHFLVIRIVPGYQQRPSRHGQRNPYR